ncbi:hypothetical protein NFI96_006620 [Prochilodus magdalenae]|nr:hypothetical protein NFI96_006620 [Prochilodus magdalenae]
MPEQEGAPRTQPGKPLCDWLRPEERSGGAKTDSWSCDPLYIYVSHDNYNEDQLWLLGLGFSPGSCSWNDEEGHAGSSPEAFYSLNQHQGVHSRSASSLVPSSPQHEGASSYQAAGLSGNLHPVISRSSLHESGAIEHPVNHLNAGLKPGMLYGGKSWSSIPKPSIVSSGGIIVVQESGSAQDSSNPNQHPGYSAKLGEAPPTRWRSGNIWSGSTSSSSFQSGVLHYSAMGNQDKPSPTLILPSRSSFSPVNPFMADDGNLLAVGVNPSASHRQGSSGFGPSQSSSGVETGAGYRSRQPASLQKQSQTSQVHLGVPQSSTCSIDIPAIYGRGSIRRCSRNGRGSVWRNEPSDASLQLEPNQVGQHYSPSRYSGSGSSMNAVLADGSRSRTAPLQSWSGGTLFRGETNQDTVPFQHGYIQSRDGVHLYLGRDEAEGSSGYMVSRNFHNPVDVIRSDYGARIPSSSAASAWNGGSPSSCTTSSLSGSSSSSPGSVQHGGVSRSRNPVMPVPELYRIPEGAVWNPPSSENRGAYSRGSLYRDHPETSYQPRSNLNHQPLGPL